MGCFFCSSFDTPSLHKLHQPCQASRDGGPCAPCQKAKQLESRISEVQGLLSELLEEHRQVRTEINHAHNPVILRVPPEITSAIFKFSGPEPTPFGTEKISGGWKKTFTTPLVLGSVCRGWRSRAWSTPQLWTYIAACLNNPSEWQTSFIRESIARSGSLPLFLDVYTTNIYPNDPTLFAMADALIDLLNQQSDRWETLCLDIPGSFISKFKGTSSASNRLILRTLILGSRTTEGEFLMDNDIPKPTRVKLYCRLLKTVNIDWEFATEAEVHYIQLDECLELLKSAPRLKRADFSAVESASETSFPLPATIVACSSLRELDIHFHDVISAIGFFDKVTLPSLERLNVNISNDLFPMEPLASFLSRSSCQLKAFTAAEFECEADDLISLLRELPSLERLILIPVTPIGFGPNRILNELAQSAVPGGLTQQSETSESENHDEPAMFLPNLRYFSFETPQRIDWALVPLAFGPLSDTHSSRRRPLRTMRFYFPNHIFNSPDDLIPKEFIPSLLALSSKGFDLEVKYAIYELDLIKATMELHGIVEDEDTSLHSG